MYSKIPMPPADWEKENMKYALCFFPWVGLAVGAVSAVLFWLLLWQGASMALGQPLLLPSPPRVLGCLGELAGTPGYWAALALSSGRILADPISIWR